MEERITKNKYFPHSQGLYDPCFEHDSCGVGFVCDIKGNKSNDVISKGLEVLRRLSHRGATGADPDTGDGAGILMQLPYKFFACECEKEGISIPDSGFYGTGLVFLPKDKKEREFCKAIFGKIVKKERGCILGWRSVPVDDSVIGVTAKNTAPIIEQIFISFKLEGLDLERRLYIIRKEVENAISHAYADKKLFFYIVSLSSRIFIYKGLLKPEQLSRFFLDLKSSDIESALSLVHSRYSTNTFATWDLSQPFRFIAHNGEINTLRGNINWMRGREKLLESKVFGRKLKKLMPVIVPGGSDSAALDNVFELLVLSGRSLTHAMSMLIPSAWEQNKLLDKKVRLFYQYHACLMEPWDGPAAVAFTDGKSIGAVLDRNGLRPARYIITKTGVVIMASEVGVLDIPPQEILSSGRLEPGKIFFIDTDAGEIIEDHKIKNNLALNNEYDLWIKNNTIELSQLKNGALNNNSCEPLRLLKAFGYTREDLKTIVKPMAEDAQEPIGSMGNDTPLAVLSLKPQLLFNYFRQLFAQVTNPAIDPIREEIVTSLETYLGPEKNILDEGPGHCHKLLVKDPVLNNLQLAKIRNIRINGFKTKVISLLFKVSARNDFKKIIDRVCKDAALAIKEGYTFVILSDRGVNKNYAALPSLLAVSAAHQYLVRKGLRKHISIILESAEPREVHNFALLFGYGADCVNPYLGISAVESLVEEGEIKHSKDKAVSNYVKAINKGILKVLSKMGISTLQSYRGAQIFEAVGLGKEVIEKYFPGTPSRINGASLKIIAKEVYLRHKAAFLDKKSGDLLESSGFYQWKRDGEFHLWNPDTISFLQDAVRENDLNKYREFSRLINDQSRNPVTLRSLLKFNKAKSIPLGRVEPVRDLVRHFATGAMSFGSISKVTHETIAIAMNRLGGRSNTGEGGEDPNRFYPLPNGDSARSAIKQVASGRFGVTANYLINADEIQIKIAQGAKPGEGGQLPGHKVSEIIARTRYTTPGVTLISPPPHHDIYSIEDLAQLIFDLKNINPSARISVKLVSEVGVGTVAAGVAKGHADMILISGGDGGTGASPLSSIKHAGLPWELGLSETHQTLVLNNLRSRVRLQADGQMRTGRDVAIAAILGAEEFGFCTAVLITLGCVMLRHCNLNNCSVGIATQNSELEKRFSGKPEYIINYFNFIAQELREIMSSLGVSRLEDLVGRVDLLELNRGVLPWKAKRIDLSRVLYKPCVPQDVITHYAIKQDYGISNILDLKLIKLVKDAIDKGVPVKVNSKIQNINRAVGAMLSSEVLKKHGEKGLPEDTIYCRFKGIAGQSFGAFLSSGITFELEGMANDYVAKGISGGKVIIYPDKLSDYRPESNILIGNTAFYGAINGEAYIRGVAGERFCIRNSGLNAVVEGVGDHGLEYMTGGRVVVLGKTGRNFAAGMSGGIAYCLDFEGDFHKRCNPDMVLLEGLNETDILFIRKLLADHYKYTLSSVAKNVLNDWKVYANKFVKVMPVEYKRILKENGGKEVSVSGEYTDG